LFLGRARERQIKTKTTPELESDPAVFGRMRSREKAAVLAVLHVFAIGFQHAGGCARLGKHLSQQFQIETERGAEGKSLCQPRGVDIHHHVDERLHLCGFASLADKAHF
jgi:hypothetical protein